MQQAHVGITVQLHNPKSLDASMLCILGRVIPSGTAMPGVVPPPSHSVVLILKPLAEAPTRTWGGAHSLSLGRAAVIACSSVAPKIHVNLEKYMHD